MTIPVLLVDDSEFDRMYTRIVLGRTGLPWAVQECECGAEGLNAITQAPGHIALVLLDLNMPGMDGFEFIDAFERLPPAVRAGTEIVVLSSSPLDTERQRALAHPVVKDYLVKPLTLPQAQHLGQPPRLAEA
ncbi:response regulator [Pelomonas sp. UHG3]|jgi:CheY-like chemotaxis protein|uniref:Response regulator n=1 Tax=Roseateles hydrophilus TaxID=2975054 RepID=A0ACC6C949_9BURK|nr:response regulator [Pelomonas sp. UHG3]MCY4744953.1 response regulator [Pelomonas sp. UHG3]